MISYNELLSGNSLPDIPIAHQQNLEALLKCVNLLRADWGKPLTVTSGYRSLQHHLDIYRSKGIPDNKIPMQSRHLTGNAVDFADHDGSLYTWALLNEAGLEAYGIWCEAGTQGWLHCQNVPYGSYKPGASRFFKV
jgi:hypothetical protein